MPDLILQRRFSTALGTPGTLFFNDLELPTVEDPIREPKTGRPEDPNALEEWVESWKQPGVTAIPAGRYLLAWSWSNTFKRFTLQLIQVPGYQGIRIHSGNKAADTRGCIIPGLDRNPNGTDVLRSVKAVAQIEPYVRPLLEEGIATYMDVRNPEGWGF